MALSIPLKEMIRRIGHDGSEVLWPELKRPWRSFHIQECIQVAYTLGYSVTHFEKEFYSTPNGVLHYAQHGEFEIKQGVLLGISNGVHHAVGVDGRMIYDPNRDVRYPLDSFQWTDFYSVDLIFRL